MKTIALYLLLILFFNVFSDESTISNSINSDLFNTDLKPTNSETSLSTSDSLSTNPDTSLSTTDSLSTNPDTSLSTIDSSSTNLDTSLSTTDSLSTNPDTSLSTTDSSSTNSDTSLSTADLSSTNLDTSLSTIAPSNGNSTDPIISNKPRIILIGFDSFQRILRNLVIFRVYFQRFLTTASSRYLYFTVITNYLRRLRVLEEQTANCSLIPDENNDMVYNCSVPVDENRDFTMSAKDDFVFSDLETDLVVSSYANSTMKSLSSQTDDIFKNGVLVLTDSTLTNNDNNFIINGNLMEGELNDNQVILSFDENGNGNLVNATCNVNDQGNKKYQLVCSSNKKIKAHLEGVMGKTSSDKPLLIHMADANNDLVDLDSSSKLNHIYPKASSNGLSTGGIIGIIIACCVALIAAAVAAFLCARKPRPPVQEINTLESNSSNSIKNNFY